MTDISYHVESTSEFAEQVLSRASGASVSHNNSVECLYDSIENFPAWENALQNAQESIFIEMYIFNDDEFGTKIRNMLTQKAEEGLCIIVVYDWFGSIKQHFLKFFKPLTDAGATVVPYNKLSLFSSIDLLSRNHRKSIIVDRKIAFISGLCFSSQWEGDLKKNKAPWRDTGVKLTGPVVKQTLEAFYDTLTSEKIPLPTFAQTTDQTLPTGNTTTRLVAGQPGTGNMIRLDMLIISMAQETLWVTDAYFMATGTYLNLLKNAALDGVDVRLLVPKTSDIRWIGAVSRTQYRSLLQAGVRIFEWNGAMIHAKSCVVDGYWSRIGSTNLNMSSWLANREIDITIQNQSIAHSLQEKFLDDIAQATEVILNDGEIAQLKAYRPRKRNTVKVKARAAARQAARLSNYLKGDARLVGKPESTALLGFGIFALFLAILFFFIPQLIAIPLGVILLISGLIFSANAIAQLWADKKNNRTHFD